MSLRTKSGYQFREQMFSCTCRPSRICGQCVLARRLMQNLKADVAGMARERKRRG